MLVIFLYSILVQKNKFFILKKFEKNRKKKNKLEKKRKQGFLKLKNEKKRINQIKKDKIRKTAKIENKEKRICKNIIFTKNKKIKIKGK